MSGDLNEVEFKLADLVDVRALQSMMDDFYELTSIPMSLLGLDGEIVVGAGWQEVCTAFHRANAETCAFCVESDTALTADIPTGEAKIYLCKNGMWDAVTPVVVGGRRVGNVFTGQFFFLDEPIDLEFFRSQARRYGFEEQSYLDAIQKVPRLSRADVDTGLRFLTKLSNMISQLSLSNTETARAEARLQAALDRQTPLTEALAAERGVLQGVMENTRTSLAYLDADFNFVAVNSAYANGCGYPASELIGRNHFDLFPDVENQDIFERVRESGEAVEFWAKPFQFAEQPWRGVTYWDWSLTPVKDSDGHAHGLAFSLHDVTAEVRRKAFDRAIGRLNEVIHSNLNRDAILAQFVPELVAATGCEAVAVLARSDEGDWSVIESFGLREELKWRHFTDGQLAVTADALSSERPVVARCDPSQPPEDLAGELGLQSLLVAPLSVPGRHFGVLSYGYLSGPGEFDEAQVDFAAAVAASLSLAWQNARLFEKEREAARLNEALTAIDHSIHGTLEPEEMLERVVVDAARALGCDSCVLDLRERDKWVIRQVYQFPAESIGRAFSDDDVPFAALAARSQRPVVIDDAFNDSRVDPQLQRDYNVRSVMVTPLIVQDAILGVLFFNYHEKTHKFSEQEVAFAERLSASLSLAIANARLYEAEHLIAERLQEALLSVPAQVDGVDFAHAYRSASEAARVGGDFYDIFPLEDGLVGITVGDVAGKGLNAATLTSLTKNTIRAHAAGRGKTPSQVLALANEVVFRTTPTDSFVTVFFGILDTRDGRFVFCNAAHTAAAVVRGTGHALALQETGPLLGAFAGVEFGQAETYLSPKDVLFLYTDGLTEARRDGEQYGEARLFKFLEATGNVACSTMVGAVIEDVVAFADYRLLDDLAILAVQLEAYDSSSPMQQQLEV